MSQVVYLSLKEISLVELNIQLMLSQQPQHCCQMLGMLFLIFRIYQYVINEHNDKLIQIDTQHTIHQTHKGSWSINQIEWNYNKLIMPIPGPECSLVYILLFDAYLMVSSSQVNLREHYCSLQLNKQAINPRQKVSILYSHFFQLPIINAQSDGTIIIPHKQHWCAPR